MVILLNDVRKHFILFAVNWFIDNCNLRTFIPLFLHTCSPSHCSNQLCSHSVGFRGDSSSSSSLAANQPFFETKAKQYSRRPLVVTLFYRTEYEFGIQPTNESHEGRTFSQICDSNSPSVSVSVPLQ